jgi:hypothetical protein
LGTAAHVVYAGNPTNQDIVVDVVEFPDQRGMTINIGSVIAALRRVLDFEMTIAEWIGTALLAAIPYLLIGAVWAATHTAHVDGMTGLDRTVSILGSTVSWPVLLFSDVCVA